MQANLILQMLTARHPHSFHARGPEPRDILESAEAADPAAGDIRQDETQRRDLESICGGAGREGKARPYLSSASRLRRLRWRTPAGISCGRRHPWRALRVEVETLTCGFAEAEWGAAEGGRGQVRNRFGRVNGQSCGCAGGSYGGWAL